MSLERWYGKPLADFTSPAAADHGAPADIGVISHEEGRMWAVAAHAAGFRGICYRLKKDPQRRRGLALFGEAGEHPAPEQPRPQPLPVGLRHELAHLFKEHPSDPLAG